MKKSSAKFVLTIPDGRFAVQFSAHEHSAIMPSSQQIRLSTQAQLVFSFKIVLLGKSSITNYSTKERHSNKQ